MRDRRIQIPFKELRWSALEKWLQFLTIFAKKPILNHWEGSEYVSGFRYVWVLNIRKFRKCDRVLNMRQDAILEGFSIFQGSEYTRFLRMQELHKVLNISEYGWIMLDGRVLNMAGQRFTEF